MPPASEVTKGMAPTISLGAAASRNKGRQGGKKLGIKLPLNTYGIPKRAPIKGGKTDCGAKK